MSGRCSYDNNFDGKFWRCPEPIWEKSKTSHCILHDPDQDKHLETLQGRLKERISNANDDDFNFDGGVFPDGVSFEEKEFKGKTSFRGAKFFGNISFRKVSFTGPSVSFESATFERINVIFDESDFYGEQAIFQNTVFKGDFVSFIDVWFKSKGKTDFSKAKFDCTQNLFRTQDKNGSRKTEFESNETLFSEAEIKGDQTVFDNTIFGGDLTSFDNAEFYGQSISFDEAKFKSKKTHFIETQFRSKVTNFNRSEFEGELVTFRISNFEGNLTDFENARFRNKKILFPGVRFLSERTSFFSSHFLGGEETETTFEKSEFGGDKTDFNSVHFISELTKFNDVHFRCKQTSFLITQFIGNQTDFFDTYFHSENTNFKIANFQGLVRFNSTKFLGEKTSFEIANIGGEVFFEGSSQEPIFYNRNINLKYLEFFNKGKILLEWADLSKAEFLHSDIKKIEFTDVIWDRPEKNWREGVHDEKVWREKRKDSKIDTEYLNYLPRINLVLKKYYADLGDNRLVGHFHYGLMEVQWFQKNLPRVEEKSNCYFSAIKNWSKKWFSWEAAYRLSCGYGEDYTKAICLLLWIFIGFACIYLFSDVPSKVKWLPWWCGWSDSLLYSFQSGAVWKIDFYGKDPHSLGIRYLIVFQSILVPVQFALFIIALRNRFRR